MGHDGDRPVTPAPWPSGISHEIGNPPWSRRPRPRCAAAPGRRPLSKEGGEPPRRNQGPLKRDMPLSEEPDVFRAVAK